ncbi:MULTISPECIES: hypothetical protein [unclassified Arthrobacter]|uniref:WXG100 family type VII secretion target n=1 Tax=unclassified Arthrobacter TaxID=235627 RepID=UPI001E4C7240|nr:MULTISPECIES: hypothetical protein [unclassified Arthrobacter]MCC9144407.1 hypothetical protein [Arthrobacter sp. zg-Y919]MDK1275633.1 hypothetical protein [Arthrobacter sp. zg.Y919]WIB02998.1 hypothetical protein QNO10_13825 [Arthrobacter sp. zg-Y919]
MAAIGGFDRGTDRQPYGVRGGSAGLLVQYEDLARAADRLAGTTARLRNLEQRVADLWLAASAWGGGSPTADRVRLTLQEAAHVLRNCAAGVDKVADGVRESARAYAEAEGRIQARLPSGGLFPLIPWITSGLLPRAEGFPTLAQVEQGLAITPAIELVARGGLFLLGGPTQGVLRPIVVTPLPGEPEEVPLDGTAAGILKRSEVLKRENDPGVIEVLALDGGANGTFVVTLPGTQGTGMGGRNPFDSAGNLEGRVEESRFISAAVAEALRRAGAEAGASVILSGYSQGGEHAAHVAANLTEEGEYEPAFVLTAGSATGSADLPPGLPALHLEHVQDWVPGIDASANPDTPDRVTMTLTNPVATPEGEDAGLGPAHRLDNYLAGAALADVSDDASLESSLGSLAAAVGAGSVATRFLYRLEREQSPVGSVRTSSPTSSRAVSRAPVRVPVPTLPPAPVPTVQPAPVPTVPPAPPRGGS